jgi:hypothetical protein
MIYETMKAVKELNHVEGFEPRQLMREISQEGRETQLYLDVQYRKLWFRLCHATGKIQKIIKQMTDDFAIVEARVYLDHNDAEENYVANAFARRFRGDGEFGPKYLELAETAAVGRALADAGFGSQFADAEGEPDPVQVDAGVPVPPAEEDDDPFNVRGIAFTPAPAAPTYTSATDVDTILASMTLEEAKKVAVNIGAYKGRTLGQIATDKPGDLQWYVNDYRGPDNILRAAAKLLLDTALAAA